MDENHSPLLPPGSNPPQAQEIARPHVRRKQSRLEQVRALTRLVIGGVEFGVDELLAHLAVWEDETAQRELKAIQQAAAMADEEGAEAPLGTNAKAEDSFMRTRYALIGMIFEAQDRLSAQHSTLRRIERLVYNVAEPLTRPVRQSRLVRPVSRRLEALAARGEAEVANWIAVGRREDVASRSLAETAFNHTVDDYIDYLTSNPEVKELVQTQSTGLANEVIEEVRERTVSADTFLEGVARNLLRRVPRAFLPQPPLEVRNSALPASRRPALGPGRGGRSGSSGSPDRK